MAVLSDLQGRAGHLLSHEHGDTFLLHLPHCGGDLLDPHRRQAQSMASGRTDRTTQSRFSASHAVLGERLLIRRRGETFSR